MDSTYIKNGYIVCKAIGDAVNSKKSDVYKIESVKDYEAIISFVDKHKLATLFSYASDRIEFLDFDKNINNFLSTKDGIFKQMKYDILSDSISKKLSENKIKHIILKGSQIQKYYPKNTIRTSTDIDVYVDKSQLEIADSVMLSQGFSFESKHSDYEFGYKKEPRYYVELHTNLEGFSDKQKEILLGFTANANKVCGERYELTDSDCYIYTLFHLYKHFVRSGVGVRMFLDIYLIKKNADIDFDYVNPILKELDIDGFAGVVDEITLALFEGKKASKDITKVIAFVLESGIFGKANANLHLSKINKSTQHMSNLQWYFINYGLGYRAMKKRYPILKKLPFLYPFSFIHRFFYGLIHKRDVLDKVIKDEKSVSSDRVDKYKEIFEIAKIKM